MNVRAVVTEVLAIAMTAIFFINIFINMPWGVWEGVGTFAVFLVLALFLIKGTLREAKQREQLADLNQHLAQKVAEQTKEIRKAYEVEKEARRELEKLTESKDQFIMITQHHLRTPVTSIQWELQSMLEGAHGPVSPQIEAALRDTQSAAGRLTHIINDFLDIAAMKTGRNILDLQRRSLKPAIEDILGELKIEIGKMGLAIEYPHDDASWPELMLDYGKMRDILLIVIENAVKYNRPGGSIRIGTQTHEGLFEISIENTGIGISAEELGKIGTALFYRGMNARNVNTVGMGVGLSVAKAIIKAHHGTFTIHSDGKDAGAKVVIGLPLK